MTVSEFKLLEPISPADYLLGVSVEKRKHGVEQVLIFWYYMYPTPQLRLVITNGKRV